MPNEPTPRLRRATAPPAPPVTQPGPVPLAPQPPPLSACLRSRPAQPARINRIAACECVVGINAGPRSRRAAIHRLRRYRVPLPPNWTYYRGDVRLYLLAGITAR